MSFIKEFDHLRIGLEAIKSATNNFGDNNCIGRGGFGKVYKGELLLSNGKTMVAIKRLDRALGQGSPEFWKEILLLTRYRHANVVSLLGFCDENGENILLYEYLSNKSLDLYLTSNDLTWKQRLNICIGAARGLQYLHNPGNTEHRVLHRDIKSSNILLDDSWNARISDFGLSKIGPANQQFTFLISNAVGTIGYCDPLYMETGYLTKESDIYSFGVVLYEVLCGRSCVGNYDDIRRFLPMLAQKCYTENKLDTIIHDGTRGQISPDCLHKFSTIAYRCLRRDRKERPLVDEIVEELEDALEYQEEYEFEKENERTGHMVLDSNLDEYWETKLPRDWKVIVRRLNIPRAAYATKKDLFSLLREGIPFDYGNKFFSINEDGKKCELISAMRFLEPASTSYDLVFQGDLRFSRVAEFPYKEQQFNIQCHIETSMLSIGVTYAACLVFKCHTSLNQDFNFSKLVTIKWKCEELSVSSTHFAEWTKEGWLKIIMWYFINQEKNVSFEIVLDNIFYSEEHEKSDIMIQGIEFWPIEMFDLETKRYEVVDWESKMPIDCEDIIQRSDKHLEYTTKKDLYFLLCAGILIDDGQKWFSLCKYTCGKCYMVSATKVLIADQNFVYATTQFESESRFKETLIFSEYYGFCTPIIDIVCEIEPDMLSPENAYACYLVFQYEYKYVELGESNFRSSCYLDGSFKGEISAHLMLPPINIPIVKPKNDTEHLESSSIPRPKGLGMAKDCMDSWVEQRNDGWMEVILCKSLHKLEEHKSLKLTLQHIKEGFDGIIVEGIEFRPMQ